MKKHGQRMMGLGMLALLMLAMASDGGRLGILPLALLVGLSVALILVGDMFTRPRRKHRRTGRHTVSRTIPMVQPAPAARSAA